MPKTMLNNFQDAKQMWSLNDYGLPYTKENVLYKRIQKEIKTKQHCTEEIKNKLQNGALYA